MFINYIDRFIFILLVRWILIFIIFNKLYMNNNDSTCLICMEDYLKNDSNNWLVRSSHCECQKIYHLKCFLNWYKNNKQCPICHQTGEDENWQILVYHNRKWKMLPFNFIIEMFTENDFFNTIMDIPNDEDIDQVNNIDKYSHVKYVIIIMLISLYSFVVTMALILQYT